MNRKIILIISISVFLIFSIGIISAEGDDDSISAIADDDSYDVDQINNDDYQVDVSEDNAEDSSSKQITVKIIWKDDDKTDSRPTSVKVNLVKDGTVVESVTLSESNSWNATFKTQNDDGNYKVEIADNLDDYSYSATGSASEGFVITNTIKDDVTGTGDDTNKNQPTTQNNQPNAPAADSAYKTTVKKIQSNKKAPSNKTAPKNSTPKKQVIKEKAKEIVKPIKKQNVSNADLKHTGIPLLLLVVVVGIAIFIPFSLRKR